MSRVGKNICMILVLVVGLLFTLGVYQWASEHLETVGVKNEYVIIDGVEYEKESDTALQFKPMYFLVFGAKAIICDIFLVYLFLSGFNKSTFSEVFERKKRRIVYVVSCATVIVVDFTVTLLFGYIYINLGNETSYSDYELYKSEESLKYIGKYYVSEEYDMQRRTLSSDEPNEVTLLFEGKFNATLLAHSIAKNGDGDSHSIGRNSALAFRKGVEADLTNVIIKSTGIYSPALYLENSTADVRRCTFSTEGANSPVLYVNGTFNSVNTTFTATNSHVFRIVNNGKISLANGEYRANGLADGFNIYITGNNKKKNEKRNSEYKDTKAEFVITEATLSSTGGDLFKVEKNNFDITVQRAGITVDNEGNFRNILNASQGSGTFTINNQMLNGGIELSDESNVTFVVQGGSTFITRSKLDDTSKLNIDLKIDSKIILTGDLYVTSFTNEHPVNANVITNGFSIYQNGQKII